MIEKTGDGNLIKRISLPTDGSKGASEAAQYIVELAHQSRAGVTLRHVVPPNARHVHVSGLEREQLRQQFLEAGKAPLTLTQAPFARAGIPLAAELREGSPRDVFAEVAAQGGHDLVIVGSRGASMSDSWLLASIAQPVARNAP